MEEMITISKLEYESLHQLVEYLQQQVHDLQKQIHDLQTELSLQKHGRDSSTSSTSPSQDIGRSNSHSLRKSNGKKSGGQAGHEGHHLSMSANPDEVISHIPEQCPQCGTSLEGVSLNTCTRRQVIDIPKPSPIYTERRSYHKICPCCGPENKVYPAEVKAPVQYVLFKEMILL